jgi:hypothetical protein
MRIIIIIIIIIIDFHRTFFGRGTFYDMNEITQNDVVAVGGGDGRRGEGVGNASRGPHTV